MAAPSAIREHIRALIRSGITDPDSIVARLKEGAAHPGQPLNAANIGAGVVNQLGFGQPTRPKPSELPALLAGQTAAMLGGPEGIMGKSLASRVLTGPMARAVVAGTTAKLGTELATGTLPKDINAIGKEAGGEAARQALMQLPATLFGVAGGALKRLRGTMREREIARKIGESRALDAAKNITPELAQIAKESAQEGFAAGKQSQGRLRGALSAGADAAVAERTAAGQAVHAELQSSPARVTLKDILDSAVRRQNALFPEAMSAEAEKAYRNSIKMRLPEVIQEYTKGSINPSKLVFTPMEADIVNKAFQRQSRTAFGQLGRGVEPRPELDRDITGAMTEVLRQKVPNLEALKKVSQDALKKVQAFKTSEASLTHPAVADVADAERLALIEKKADIRASASARRMSERREAQDRLIRERVLQARSANPFALVRTIPTPGTVSTPRAAIKPGFASEFGGTVGSVISNPLFLNSTGALARFLAYLESRNK